MQAWGSWVTYCRIEDPVSSSQGARNVSDLGLVRMLGNCLFGTCPWIFRFYTISCTHKQYSPRDTTLNYSLIWTDRTPFFHVQSDNHTRINNSDNRKHMFDLTTRLTTWTLWIWTYIWGFSIANAEWVISKIIFRIFLLCCFMISAMPSPPSCTSGCFWFTRLD